MCQGLMFLFGLYALLVGRIRIMGNRTVHGSSARFVGIILILPAIVSLLLLFFAYPMVRAQRDMSAAYSISGVEALVTWGSFIGAIIIGLATSSSLNPNNVPNVMTLREAATYLRVSDKDLREVLDSGKLKVIYIGSQMRINKVDLDEYLRTSSGSVYKNMPERLS